MADEEYPAWLWRVLDKTSADQAGVVVDEGDLYGMFYLFFCSFCLLGLVAGEVQQGFLFCSALSETLCLRQDLSSGDSFTD